MAKKNSVRRKTPSKSNGSAKKAATKKSAPKKSAARKSSKPAAKAGSTKRRGATGAGAAVNENPSRVTTGSGANPETIGRSLVDMFNRGQFKEIEAKWWSPSIVSIEGLGMAWHGRKAVEEKNGGWMAQNRIVGASAEGPFIGATGFAVKFRMEVEEIATGKRTLMEEVGVYTVQDGKIEREEFMYGSAK